MNRKALTQLIISAVLLLLAIGGYGVWFTVVTNASAQAHSLSGEIATKTDDTKRIAQARSALDLLHSNEVTVAQYFVSITDVVTFLGGLQSLGQSLGSQVSVLSVSADGKVPRGNLALSIKISGPFDAVVRTLGAIEYGPYDIQIVDLTLDTPVTQIASASTTPVTATWTAAAVFTVGTASAATTTAK